MLPVGSHFPLEVNEGDLFDISSSRGEGGFGSTGVK
jgi:dUTPase